MIRRIWRSLMRRARAVVRYQGSTYPARSPLEFCLFAMLAVWVAPGAIGVETLPGSIEQTGAVGNVAALVLWLGALAAVVGMCWPRRWYGLAGEWLGVLWAGSGLLFYGVAVAAAQPFANAAFTAGTCIGLGIGCFARGVQILLFVVPRGMSARGTDGAR